ncbi:MAG: ribbon-helix-helix domain-containing protein [Sulfolobales archaeon]|nr:ribbon-helix-helix domain-containing protein [Sulfolobales archaeon]MCX8186523.1 ribbon-helix-helix domain-containing protein [Sulfolobales archaeon]MDW7969071.1 ribbon-helix-helix domain-containing protein [Sulfolobales archaeon]
MDDTKLSDDLNDDAIQSNSRTLSIKLEYNTLAKIDYLLRHYKFPSRSAFIRNAIMYKINQLQKQSLTGG